MGKLEDAKRAAAEAAQRRAAAVGTSPPERETGTMSQSALSRYMAKTQAVVERAIAETDPEAPYEVDPPGSMRVPVEFGELKPWDGKSPRKPLHPKVAAAIEKTRAPRGRPIVEGQPMREGTPAQRLEVRLRAGERAKLVLAADLAGLPLSVWAREILLRACEKS